MSYDLFSTIIILLFKSSYFELSNIVLIQFDDPVMDIYSLNNFISSPLQKLDFSLPFLKNYVGGCILALPLANRMKY